MKHIAEQPLLLTAPPESTSTALVPVTTVAIQTVTTPVGTVAVVSNDPSQLLTAPAKKHHKYGPSRLGYLDSCAGFCSREGTNAAAEEGTSLHEKMEQILGYVVKGAARTAMEGLRLLATTIDFTDEERDYLRFCCIRCDVYLAKKPKQILTEISVQICAEDGKEMNHGSLDVAYIWDEVAIIQDFKFGWVPVKHAQENLQGMNYALGVFQKFRSLKFVGVEFDQPKLNWFSTGRFARVNIADMFERCSSVIARAEFVQDHPEEAQPFMKPGNYCQYCSRSGSCAVLANARMVAGARANDLPVPTLFKGLQITTPSDMALARYWVDIVEAGIGEIKEAARDMAELAENQEISCTLPNGEVITYAMAEKNKDRSLGSAIEVSVALQEVLTPEEVLGAAELALGKLESIAKNAMVEAAKLRGEKLTKKAAWEQIVSTLEANGLLTRPDGKIRYLKRKKQAPVGIEQPTDTKQIEQGKE